MFYSWMCSFTNDGDTWPEMEELPLDVFASLNGIHGGYCWGLYISNDKLHVERNLNVPKDLYA